MYIKVSFGYNQLLGDGYQWLLFSHTGLVMARSDFYGRHCDATRVGKQIASRLQIAFRGDI